MASGITSTYYIHTACLSMRGRVSLQRLAPHYEIAVLTRREEVDVLANWYLKIAVSPSLSGGLSKYLSF
jgi:hypothetical protein